MLKIEIRTTFLHKYTPKLIVMGFIIMLIMTITKNQSKCVEVKKNSNKSWMQNGRLVQKKLRRHAITNDVHIF